MRVKDSLFLRFTSTNFNIYMLQNGFPSKGYRSSKSVYLTNITKYPMIEIEIICIMLLAFTSKAKSIVLFMQLSKAFKSMSDLGVSYECED
jgi:hypothetical protein